jgi:hypothetical protein
MGLTMLLHYWESAPNPTEDRKFSTKKTAAGSSLMLFSKLNGFDHCYIAGKMLQIRSKTANFQKKSTAAGSSVYFPQN